jgi:Tfp pilus assembly protein PilN
MSEGINLLGQGKKKASEAYLRRVNTTRLIMFGLLFIVSVSSVILFILVALSPLPALKEQEASLTQTLTRSKEDIIKFDLLKERVSSVNTTLNKRHSMAATLTIVQSKLPKDSEITALKSDMKNVTITIESPSLQSLDGMLSGFIELVQDKKTFSNVTLTDLTTDASTNEYSVTFSLTLL